MAYRLLRHRRGAPLRPGLRAEVRANLIRAGFTNVLVPAVHEALCSRRLMVMVEI